MRIDGEHRRTIWVGEDGRTVAIIDQTRCRTSWSWPSCATSRQRRVAIESMQVRGAPLIGGDGGLWCVPGAAGDTFGRRRWSRPSRG